MLSFELSKMKSETSYPSDTKFSYEDYLLFADDRNRHEIIDGHHYMTPAPGTRHQRISRRLLTAFENFLREDRAGEIFAAPCDVVLSDIDVVQPDLLLVLAPRATMITDKNISGVPDLMIEIVSESSRKIDEVVKRKLYERFGVREYWLIDPEMDTVRVYRLDDRRYVRPQKLSLEANDWLDTPLLPGFGIALREILQ